MKILILYDSGRGNTERMAEFIADGAAQVNDVEVEMKKATEADPQDLIAADGIIIGSPNHYGQMSGELKTFMDRTLEIHGKLSGKVGGAFTSSGRTASGTETTLLSIIESMLVHGMVVQGRSDNEHYGAVSVGSPAEEEMRSCKDLGMRVAALAYKLKGKESLEKLRPNKRYF